MWDELASSLFWYRIGTAVLCGGMLGIERQLRGKPAGIRTSVLITLGAMTFIRLGADLRGPGDDATRVLAQVVTGIGFLGAGVIITSGGLVRGMTSAAVVWLLAAVGAAIGVDRPDIALSTTVVALVVLVGVQKLERSTGLLRRGVHGAEMAASDGEGNGGKTDDPE